MIPNYNEGPLQNFNFHEGDIMFDMPQRDYLDLFNTIPWTCPKDA